MATRPDTPPAPQRSSAWFGIGIFLFIVLLGLIFFVLASTTLRHRFLNRQPAEGNPPTSAPRQDIAH